VDTTASAVFSFDASGNLATLGLTSGTATPVAFSGSQIGYLHDSNNNIIYPDFITVINGTTGQGIVSNPKSAAWNYQSFGFWETWDSTTNTRTVNNMSVGAPTAGTPDGSGPAQFAGQVVGSYVDASGVGHAVHADLTINANFGNHSLDFATTGTTTSTNWVSFTSNPSLDMSGTLTYTLGTNGFSGQLQTAGGLSGKSTGQFYGPSAQELGGVFSLNTTNSPVETYSGAYGAKR